MSDSMNGNLSQLITRYAGQVIQALTTLAGLTGLFYAIGFIFVNLRLMRLGLFEPGLVRVGYTVPGMAFGMLCLIVLIMTYLCFKLYVFTHRRIKRLKYLILLISAILASAGAWGLARLLWFWQNQSLPVAIWLNVLALLFMTLMPELSKRIDRSQQSQDSKQASEGEPPASLGEELDSPTDQTTHPSRPGFVVPLYFVLAIAAIVTYGYFVFPEIPPAFGGGQPIVVRFFGDHVADLGVLGIRLEPGETKLTERVELIAETSDRYIVHVGNRAVAFDQTFVQGVRSEPPEFFLNEEAFMEKHINLGQRYLVDGAHARALSEFNRALSRRSDHILALRGRAETFSAQENYRSALTDYQTLIDIEPTNGENFYALAVVMLLAHQQEQKPIPIDELAEALYTAFDLDSTLQEQARQDVTFAGLRGQGGSFEPIDEALYDSGPAASRWFRQAGGEYAEAGDIQQALTAYETAVAYAEAYATHTEAMTSIEIVAIHLAIRDLYLQQGQWDQAITTLQTAAEVDGLSPTEEADVYVTLSDLYLQSDPLSEEALQALQKAVQVTEEQDPTYLILLADLYRARDEPELARVYYDNAGALTTAGEDDRRLALIGLGRSSMESGNYIRAISAFESALEISAYNDQDASLWYDYARALAARQSNKTQAALRIALDLDTDLAIKAEQEDDFSSAGTAVENLIKGAASFHEARQLRNQGDLEGAIAAYRQATGADPSVVRYWQELGDTLVQAGQHDDAVIAYGVALHPTEFPDYSPIRLPDTGGGDETLDPALLTVLGSAQLASGDPEAAAASLVEAITSMAESTPASTYSLLAQAYEALGAYRDAAAAYEQAAAVDPSQPNYVYLAGVNWLLAGQTENGLGALSATFDQGGLRVIEATGVGLRDAHSGSGVVVVTLGIGAQLRITGEPVVAEGRVWWPVADRDENTGWVRAMAVVPSLPPDVTLETGE